MGVMRKVLLVFAILAVTNICANASVTIEQSTDPEYLINSGYSEAMAEDVFMSKNRVKGQTIEPLYEKSNNKFVRFWKNAFSYIDPALDNSEERYHHDIHLSPSWRDL